MTDVVVIGAGLAGSLLTLRLHERGLHPRWIDAGTAERASSCPCALVHPFAGRSFQPRPEVFDAWSHARRLFDTLGPGAQVHAATLVRHVADDDAGRRLWSSWTRHAAQLRTAWDGTFEVDTARDGTRAIAYGPVYALSLAGAVDDVHARLHAVGLVARSMTVGRVVRGGEGWVLDDGAGGPSLSARHVVVAAGSGTRALLAGCDGAPAIEHVEGTLRYGPGGPLERFVVDGGHVASTARTMAWGASYRALDRSDDRAHAPQLDAIEARLRPRTAAWPQQVDVWRGIRVVDPHRRHPWVGPIAPGLWAMTAFGSQGGLWIPRAASDLARTLANLSSD